MTIVQASPAAGRCAKHNLTGCAYCTPRGRAPTPPAATPGVRATRPVPDADPGRTITTELQWLCPCGQVVLAGETVHEVAPLVYRCGRPGCSRHPGR